MRTAVALAMIFSALLVEAQTTTPSPGTRYIKAGVNGLGEKIPIDFWDSKSSMLECETRRLKGIGEHIKSGRPIRTFEEPSICAEGRLGRLTAGTRVELLPSDDLCGDMARIKILSGKYEGKTGCTDADRILTEMPK